MDLTHSDAGTLYSLHDNSHLRFEVVMNRTLNINNKAPDINFPDIEVYRDGESNNSMMVASSVLQEKSIRVDDVYKEESFNFSGTRAFDKNTGYLTHSVLTVPIRDFEKKIIGVIQLINALDVNNKIRIYNDKDEELVNLFVLQTAFTLSSKILIDKQKTLFNSIQAT